MELKIEIPNDKTAEEVMGAMASIDALLMPSDKESHHSFTLVGMKVLDGKAVAKLKCVVCKNEMLVPEGYIVDTRGCGK